MGAAKAGVSIVTFAEKENFDALHNALKDSGARGLLLSPNTQVNEAGERREDFLKKHMSDLYSLYPGDAIKLKDYPHLK